LRAEVVVGGIVQGVGFRPFIYRTATCLGLVGFVRNRGDAGVEIVVEGGEERVKQFVADLRDRKPPLAVIHALSAQYSEDRREFEEFRIYESVVGGENPGSVIPPDVSICGDCLNELQDPENRRYDYFFITCTDCGPRFTVIEKLPYDRVNTTMRSFKLCPDCSKDYADPSDRRFHAQTIACPRCGPKVFLTTREGRSLDVGDPVVEAGKLLEEGYIVAVKGNGGFHIATATTLDEPIGRIRQTKDRLEKPFAIMARNMETVKSFAYVNALEEALLTSYIKPIVLLRKREDYGLSHLVSPGLNNVGVMLPYTGLHTLLFKSIREPAMVFTSGNAPGEPIITENREALEKMGAYIDFFLLHNRDIAHRCDDSVVRVVDGCQAIVRRSRGYAPAPVPLGHKAKRCILGLGAELNVTASIILEDKAYISQHIGDMERVETLDFLRNAVDHLTRLITCNVEVVACDLHPRFYTSRLAAELSDRFGYDLVRVQHHHAHGAALMAEHGVDEVVTIACDGLGYGSDGNLWGGEVLYCNREGFRRLGHLQNHPMVGGDLATVYPLRMAAGILNEVQGLEEWLFKNTAHFPHEEREVEVVLKGLRRVNWPQTSSCGRVLDAVSALLGLCYRRTYEGEPAMKLEAAASVGRDVLSLETVIEGRVIDTRGLVQAVFEQRGKHSAADLAYSTEVYVAKSLAQLAVEEAERLGVKAIGFSGGVAYNEHIVATARNIVEGNRIRFLTHTQVPPGDGGISFGQGAAVSFTYN